MLKKFDETRQDLKPYGLTCELWQPKLMERPDRHNEIEINYLPEGSLTYLIHDQKLKIQKGRMIVFWALFPHQIVDFSKDAPYHVITIPFSTLLSWNLPKRFLEMLFRGELKATTYKPSNPVLANQIFERWADELNRDTSVLKEICSLEIEAYLKRFAYRTMNATSSIEKVEPLPINLVEQIAVYIANNFNRPIKVVDVAKAVGLHPDYANVIFKKTFGYTISDYLLEQRVLYAKRKLSITQDSITSIAYDSGFNSISRFNASFRKSSGMTPRDFRKELNT